MSILRGNSSTASISINNSLLFCGQLDCWTYIVHVSFPKKKEYNSVIQSSFIVCSEYAKMSFHDRIFACYCNHRLQLYHILNYINVTQIVGISLCIPQYISHRNFHSTWTACDRPCLLRNDNTNNLTVTCNIELPISLRSIRAITTPHHSQ